MASGSVSEEPNSQIFTLLLFSWNLITDYERKELLYADHEDPFMSLFSKEKFDEMDQFLVDKVASINKSCEPNVNPGEPQPQLRSLYGEPDSPREDEQGLSIREVSISYPHFTLKKTHLQVIFFFGIFY